MDLKTSTQVQIKLVSLRRFHCSWQFRTLYHAILKQTNKSEGKKFVPNKKGCRNGVVT